MLLGPLGTSFSEIRSKIRTFSFKKMLLKMSSAKWRPFCLSLIVLKDWRTTLVTEVLTQFSCNIPFPVPEGLTHWVRDKMAAIIQTAFSYEFSWMKMYKFQLRFHWSVFPRVQQQYSTIGSDNGFGAVQVTSHYLDQWWLVCWCIRHSALMG